MYLNQLNVDSRIARFFVLFCFLFLPLVPVDAQKLEPDDIDPETEDTRCVEKNYRHKTARELAQMTPEQLIDESQKEWNHHSSLMDDYDMFTLRSYKQKIGVEIVPVLTRLARGFASRPLSKCQQGRFFTAFAIAADVDNQIVRLRSREAGQAAIAAAEEAIQRMKDAGLADTKTNPYNKYAFGMVLLERVRGINDHDEEMRKLLEAEFRLSLSDEEFFGFVKFLTASYPTYPSWTPRINMSRNFRTNKKKYHEAYLQFKKEVRSSNNALNVSTHGF